MKYPEYLEAAKRHKLTCEILKQKIDLDIQSQRPINNYQPLILNLYYLTGYILECSLKFKIFELCQFCDNTDINIRTCAANDINYNKQIKTHSFDTLQNTLNSQNCESDYQSNDIDVNELMDHWGPAIRYEHRDLNIITVNNLYTHVIQYLRRV